MAAHSAFRRLLDEAAALEMRELQRKRALERQAAKSKPKDPFVVGMQEFAALEASLSKPASKPRPLVAKAPEGAKQAAAAAAPPPPREPEPYECCGNDCPNCVWIEYWEKLQAWDQLQAEEQAQGEML